MKIALCDDDEKELSNIRSLLDSYQKTHNIPFTYQEYHSSCELALQASKERFDIYLLDILMPHMTGMQLAREIRTFDHAADIIFLTTSSDFAVESYTVKATNYLMKPVSSNAFFAAMDDILRAKTQEQGHFLVLKSRIGVHKIPLSELKPRTAKLSTTRVEGNRSSAQNCSRPYATAFCNTGNLFRCTARSL